MAAGGSASISPSTTAWNRASRSPGVSARADRGRDVVRVEGGRIGVQQFDAVRVGYRTAEWAWVARSHVFGHRGNSTLLVTVLAPPAPPVVHRPTSPGWMRGGGGALFTPIV